MGSPFNIIIYSTDSVAAQKAAWQTYKLIDTLNLIYSDYLPESELNRLCETAGDGRWINVSKALSDVLQKAVDAGKASSGSFDITMSPVIRLWRTARREKRLPCKDSLLAARRKVGYRYIKTDTGRKAVRLMKTGMQLDLGGIAKGETAGRAYLRLCALGFPFSLIDAGGDIVAGDVPPGVPGWRIAINLPESEDLMNRQLLLRNKAVTTSGDVYQYLYLNGMRYSHIINPATGWALTNARNVTVISGDAASADWLTKACSILPVREALKLVKRFPATEVQIATIKKGKCVFYRSAAFHTYFEPAGGKNYAGSFYPQSKQ